MINTKRLFFRTISLIDLEDIHRLHSLPETDKFNTLGMPEGIETTKKILAEWITAQKQNPRKTFIFTINLIETNQLIGLIAINLGKPIYRTAEVWYKTHKDYWGNGYTTEALKQIINFGFNELNLHRIEAGCATENLASIRVLEKVGMIREGMKRKILPIRGSWKDNYFYAILEEEFFRTSANIPV